MCAYQETPLGSAGRNIRVLKLLQSSDDNDATSDICCELSIMSLDDRPVYQALSYVWGPEESDKFILLNGERFRIRENLYDCLWHLRQRGGTALDLPLWVDAICINQDDLTERNGSVLLMGEVYRSAEKVISWLGSDSKVMAGTLAIRDIANRWVKLDKVDGAPNPFTLHHFSEWPESWTHWFHENREVWDADADAITSLMLYDYWRRVWIVQEIVLAGFDAHELVCGTESVSYTALHAFASCVQNLFGAARPEQLDESAWATISMGIRGECKVILELEKVRSGILTPSLMFVLYVSSTRQCSDPRDAVYGLLNLIPDHDIVPDYSRSVHEIYVDWAIKAMTEAESLNLLSYVENGGGKQWSNKSLDLPSWVPDLYNIKHYRLVPWHSKQKRVVDSPSAPARLPLFKVLPGSVLKVQGFLCDIVEGVKALESPWRETGEAAEPATRNPTLPYMRFCMDYLLKMAQQEEWYKAYMPPLQALVKVTMHYRLPSSARDWDPDSRSTHEAAVEFMSWLLYTFIGAFKGSGPDEEVFDVASSLMGISLGEGFSESYEASVFPGIDVCERYDWSTLADAYEASGSQNGKMKDFIDYMISWCDGRRMLETRTGYLGHANLLIEPGDLIFSIEGCDSLLALRKAGSGFSLLGECYFLGLSDGEARAVANEQGLEAEGISIV
jgi:hypothetical protein